MSAIKNKLKSNSGASITFALLLFLVCAVISSVVIVASTAAGGRVSQMAKMDQRYYAVSSAAELLRDVLEKQTVVATRKTVKKETVTVDTTTADPEGVSSKTTLKEDVTYNVTINEKDPGDALLAMIAKKHGGLEWLVEADYYQSVTVPDILEWGVVSSDEDEKIKDALAVKVKVDIDDDEENGAFVLNVCNQDSSGSTYTLSLTFEMEKSTTTDTRVENGPKVPGEKVGEYTMEAETTTTVKTTMRWQMTGIQTVNAAGSGEI